jgi:two-component system sensor histidine kinase UhpB
MRGRYLPLFVRIVLANLLVLVAACLLILIALGPSGISELAADEVLIGTLVLVTLINVLLVRRIVLPLQQLTETARGIDSAKPGIRFPRAEASSEAGELALTFNEMLDRLERERAESARSVLAAHEGERMRVAQELHDEVGQTLTAVLLQLSRVQARAGPELKPLLGEAQETVRNSLEDVRRIATELRPETLADLGLASALASLSDTFTQRTGLEVRPRIAHDLPPLAGEAELALYRVAQEALTNVARHSGSGDAELTLARNGDALTLSVRDHGRGLDDGGGAGGNGIRGMRERADAIGARLAIGAPADGQGNEVKLVVSVDAVGTTR